MLNMLRRLEGSDSGTMEFVIRNSFQQFQQENQLPQVGRGTRAGEGIEKSSCALWSPQLSCACAPVIESVRQPVACCVPCLSASVHHPNDTPCDTALAPPPPPTPSRLQLEKELAAIEAEVAALGREGEEAMAAYQRLRWDGVRRRDEETWGVNRTRRLMPPARPGPPCTLARSSSRPGAPAARATASGCLCSSPPCTPCTTHRSSAAPAQDGAGRCRRLARRAGHPAVALPALPAAGPAGAGGQRRHGLGHGGGCGGGEETGRAAAGAGRGGARGRNATRKGG